MYHYILRIFEPQVSPVFPSKTPTMISIICQLFDIFYFILLLYSHDHNTYT